MLASKKIVLESNDRWPLKSETDLIILPFHKRGIVSDSNTRLK